MSSVIEDIKSRLNIVDIAAGYLKLEKAGGNFKACCPFHNERTPSFFISPARQTYHCFGCNKGGDIISFVEEVEGLDFQGALKILEERAGVELKRERPGVKDEREAIFAAMELATKFYEAVLPKFPDAVSYLTGRGLTQETIKGFRVGFAPDEWRSLGDFLTKKGIPESVMERAGLIVRSPKGFYDRFRGRIMFPITDSSGRVIAFSGRILKEEAGKTLGASASAKYVNSPETEIFHKSRALFGFFQAREAIRRDDSCVLVEGQMDLILSHQSGVKNTVASSGTALTPEHLEIIKRFTNNLVLALDADSAGQAATRRAIELALSQGMEVFVVKIPLGKDPGDAAREDPEGWKRAVEAKMPVIDFYLNLLPEINKDKMALLKATTDIIVPFIHETNSVMKQGHYVGEVAKLLNIKEDAVWEEIKKYRVTPTTGGQTLASTKNQVLTRQTRIARTIEGVLRWQESMKENALKDIAEYRARFTKLLDGPPDIVDGDALIFEAEARLQGSERVEEELKELLKGLEEEILREKFTAKMAELKQAESAGDVSRAEKLLAECQVISKELHTLTKTTL